MASSTTTRKPANGDRERMDRGYAQQALENRPTVDDPTGADRNADIVLGAAVKIENPAFFLTFLGAAALAAVALFQARRSGLPKPQRLLRRLGRLHRASLLCGLVRERSARTTSCTPISPRVRRTRHSCGVKTSSIAVRH